MNKHFQHWQIRGLIGIFATVASGCGEDEGKGEEGEGEEGEAEGEVVNVSLVEFEVNPDASSAPAGMITFHVSNDGTELHEFLVIKTDLAEDALPTNADGSYEEDGSGTELIDEIKSISPGSEADLTLDLDAANYVLICNMVEKKKEGPEAHYAEGMHVSFTVE